MQDDEETVNTFRNTLNGFKKPYIDALEKESEKPAKKDEEAMTSDDLQMNERVQDVLDMMDTLYTILEAAIRQGQNTNPDLNAQAVSSVFEKNGVLPAVRNNAGLRDKLLECLRVEIKLYPFTLRKGLINSFLKDGVETHQREIVEN